MQTATIFIETRSKAQALDWSLVLISQGIESVLTPGVLEEKWSLEVALEDHLRANAAIATYEKENSTSWKRELPGSGLLFDARAVVWFLALALFFWASAPFVGPGIMDARAVASGEWWRLVTAVTLHADVAHLAANISIGILFLGLAMGCFGAANAMLLSLLGGVLGNVATYALHLHEPFRSLGASGMVMAALGLITSHSLAYARHEKRTLLLGRGLMAGCLLVVLLGFSPRSDIIAHVGGFIGGVLLGAAALGFRKWLFRPVWSLASLGIFVGILGGAWWLALR